jgi:hypothetical protein
VKDGCCDRSGSPDQCTFRQLDGNVETRPPEWPLEIWYEKVRDIPLSEMEVEDLARACRQELYLEEIIPLCLEKLEEDPLAGELYDGEMVVALKGVGKEYWQQHPDKRKRFLELAALAYRAKVEQEMHRPDDLIVTEEHLMR